MAELVKALAIETGLPEPLVHRIIITAPIRYKVYQINKRSGGTRTISQPAREVKFLQRAFSKLYLEKLPVHQAATAYRKGTSIYHNAQAHANAGAILKMDFAEFFPSIRKADWIRYCETNHVFGNVDDQELSASLLFRRPRNSRQRLLAIGAPSSPALSNILMYDFDTAISEIIQHDRVTYTRYADDLTFSAERAWNLISVEKAVKHTIRELASPRLAINTKKTVLVTKKYCRAVTGLIITNDQKVSVGKTRKRLIHAKTHAASLGKLSAQEMQRLAGMLAFIRSVEPDFLNTLQRRYGREIVEHLQTKVVQDRTRYIVPSQSAAAGSKNES